MTELSTCLEVKLCKEFVVSLVVSSYDRVGSVLVALTAASVR